MWGRVLRACGVMATPASPRRRFRAEENPLPNGPGRAVRRRIDAVSTLVVTGYAGTQGDELGFGEDMRDAIRAGIAEVITNRDEDGLLHSDEGGDPAVEYYTSPAHGYNVSAWYKHGLLHRDDGDKPAVEWSSGRREWWREGERHRDGDKPAIITETGATFRFVRGRLHCAGDTPAYDDPAILRSEYYKDDVLHRDNDLPAVIDHDNRDWFQRGRLHRTGGPALVHANRVEWYRNGVLHRDDGDLPALEHTHPDGRRFRSEWYRDGVLHRDGDKPALVHESDVVELEWYRDGALHRDSDKPARVIALSQTPVEEGWYRDGKLHRDGDKPAWIRADGCRRWYQDGKLHRDGDNPAVIEGTGANGVQRWYQHGKLHRVGAPAIIHADGEEEWWEDDEVRHPTVTEQSNWHTRNREGPPPIGPPTAPAA